MSAARAARRRGRFYIVSYGNHTSSQECRTWKEACDFMRYLVVDQGHTDVRVKSEWRCV